jgi:hypothetical protein
VDSSTFNVIVIRYIEFQFPSILSLFIRHSALFAKMFIMHAEKQKKALINMPVGYFWGGE